MAREITATTRALPRLEEREVKIISLKRIVFLRFIRHKMAVFGTLVVLFMVSFAFVGPFIVTGAIPGLPALGGYQPDQVNLRERFAKPSFIMVAAGGGQQAAYNIDAFPLASDERPLKFGHPMGTDDLGRDTMTRAMFGGRVSLGIGFTVALLSILFGATFGAVSGYLGG